MRKADRRREIEEAIRQAEWATRNLAKKNQDFRIAFVTMRAAALQGDLPRGFQPLEEAAALLRDECPFGKEVMRVAKTKPKPAPMPKGKGKKGC